MKIALLASNFPSPGRPVYVFVQQLVIALVDLGHEVSVIAPQSLTHSIVRKEKILPKHNIEYTDKGNQFEVYRPYSVSFGNGKRWLYSICQKYNQRGLHKVLDKIKPDILYGHFWYSANKLKEYASKHKLPLFVACGEGDNALEDLVEKLSANEQNKLVDLVKGVICVSSENKRKCIEFGLAKEENVIVLPNCVDDSQFHPMDATLIREQLGVAENEFLIIFVGGFIKRKGPDRLMSAIEKLTDNEIKVIFIGKYREGDGINPTGENIVFKGTIDHDKLAQYINAADLFVLPTLKEGCSNAIVEALACGVPVISANLPFNDDILNENNSITINPENVDEIAEAIYKLKNDKKLYSTKKQYVTKNCNQYSIIERAKKIANFIESMIY